MQRQPDGTLAPDPRTQQSGAYPLTMVEYAFVPRQALVDPTTCKAREETQELLELWLAYLVTFGQHALPAGFQPLTPALQDQAHRRHRASSAASPPAASNKCKAPPHPPATPPGGGGGGFGDPGSFGSFSSDGGFDGGSDPPATAST